MMKKLTFSMLVLTLCALMAFSACGVAPQVTTTAPTPTTPSDSTSSSTFTGVPDGNVMAQIMQAFKDSAPYQANSTVTLKVDEELTLTSTFTVDNAGNCHYVVQKLKPYEVGASASDLIETIEGDKKATDNPSEGIQIGSLDLSEAYFSNYGTTAYGNLVLTALVKDDCIDDLLGFDLDASDLVLTVNVSSKGRVLSVVIEYETEVGHAKVETKYYYT